MILTSLLAALIPMLTYLFLLWRMDKYEPEPIKVVLKHFLWGAFGAIFFAIIAGEFMAFNLRILGSQFSEIPIFQAIIIAPFVEELTKGLYLIRTSKRRVFDNMTDGMVYGGAIGLGFGMTENFMYFIAYGDTVSSLVGLVIIRSGFSAVMHCIATATVGAFIGFAKFSIKKHKLLLYPIGFLIAMLLHFAWNLSVSFQSTYFWGLLFMLMIIVSFLMVFQYSIRQEEKILAKELADEGLPGEHVKILSSKLRSVKGWVDETVRIKYIAAATKLAFRKVEERNANPDKRSLYQNEVELYRSELIKITEFLNKSIESEDN